MEEEKKAPVLEEGQTEENITAAEEEESLADSVKIVSPGRLVAKRFFRSRLSMVGLVTLIVLFLFSFLGPLFVPWGEIETDNTVPEEKRESYIYTNYVEEVDPTVIFQTGNVSEDSALNPGFYWQAQKPSQYWVEGDETSKDYPRGVKVVRYGSNENDPDCVFYTIVTGADTAIYVCDGGTGRAKSYLCTEYSWDHKPFNQLGKIDARHWLGTDEQGMDVFVRLMYGGRISLTLGFVVVFFETFLGVIFGGLAGYFGKWVDQIIMRIVDIFNCIPTFPILLILSAVLDGMDIDQQFRIYYLMMIMTLLGWSGIARVVRGQILFLREQEYMIAAEALGLSVPRKIFRHLLPNIMPQLIVQMTLGLGSIILTESTLSYLGIGIPIPYAAWGTMISSAQKPEILQNYPNLWIPAGILIVLAVLAFNFVGDGLRDAFDPKASR